MAKQARCHKCKVHYVWAKDRPLRDLMCPECWGKLARTATMGGKLGNGYRRVNLPAAPTREGN